MTKLDDPPPGSAVSRFLNWIAVRSRVSLSRSTVWRKIQEGSFPAPIRLSKGRVGWLENDIERWINAQLDAADRRQGEGILRKPMIPPKA
jgi:prophage regulatory protein